ncbi:hypothetical protein, partial [Actinoplanes xinjiangensis]|uniref:hypothetical protein n=1 Tax=Actinoplanes xinjiangensis TaxID=512350 RepID=UPI00341B7EB9
MNTVVRHTLDELGRQRRAVTRLAGWSVVEALPALASGYAIARAVDDGFLAGRPTVVPDKAIDLIDEAGARMRIIGM